MSKENVDVTVDADLDREARSGESGGPDRSRRTRLWVNWSLALLAVVGAAVAVVYFFSAVMSTAGCSASTCRHAEPNWISPNVVLYGPPVVAALTVVVSFFTARRRWGFVVPVFALAVLIGDVATLAVTVAQ
jgi:hypothetical protein